MYNREIIPWRGLKLFGKRKGSIKRIGRRMLGKRRKMKKENREGEKVGTLDRFNRDWTDSITLVQVPEWLGRKFPRYSG